MPLDESEPISHGPPSESRPAPPGHLLRTYRGESFPWTSVLSFLTGGIADNRRLLYLYDRSDPETLKERLRGLDVAVDRLRASGQLRIRAAQDHYLRDGALEPDALIQALRSALVDAVRAGFDGLDVVGEVGREAISEVSPTALIEYERRVGEVMSPERVQALCIYPADELDGDLLATLRKVHGKHFPQTESGAGKTWIGLGEGRPR